MTTPRDPCGRLARLRAHQAERYAAAKHRHGKQKQAGAALANVTTALLKAELRAGRRIPPVPLAHDLSNVSLFPGM